MFSIKFQHKNIFDKFLLIFFLWFLQNETTPFWIFVEFKFTIPNNESVPERKTKINRFRSRYERKNTGVVRKVKLWFVRGVTENRNRQLTKSWIFFSDLPQAEVKQENTEDLEDGEIEDGEIEDDDEVMEEQSSVENSSIPSLPPKIENKPEKIDRDRPAEKSRDRRDKRHKEKDSRHMTEAEKSILHLRKKERMDRERDKWSRRKEHLNIEPQGYHSFLYRVTIRLWNFKSCPTNLFLWEKYVFSEISGLQNDLIIKLCEIIFLNSILILYIFADDFAINLEKTLASILKKDKPPSDEDKDEERRGSKRKRKEKDNDHGVSFVVVSRNAQSAFILIRLNTEFLKNHTNN